MYTPLLAWPDTDKWEKRELSSETGITYNSAKKAMHGRKKRMGGSDAGNLDNRSM